MAVVRLTKAGYAQLMAELEDLKVNRRRENAEKLKVAREQGDLSENAEYDAAKDEQSEIENRIVELEDIQKHHIIVDEGGVDTDTVQIGCSVHLQNDDTKEEYTYEIKTSTESDILKGSISDECPVGMAIRGRKVGDIVAVEAPNGSFKYKILDFHRN